MTSADEPGWQLGVRLVLASRALFDELHHRLDEAGFNEFRPAHGYLLQAVGTHGATASEIAAHLGMTKQAARLMVDELVELGYVARAHDVADARRRPVLLTSRGVDALRCSAEIFDQLRAELAAELGPRAYAQGMRLLRVIDDRYGPAPLRPVW